jgi:hypothetical protein
MGTRLTFDDLHVSPPPNDRATPVRPFHLPMYADDDADGRSPPRISKPLPTAAATRTPGLLGRTPGRTPGTVSFHPEVHRRHGPLSPQERQHPPPSAAEEPAPPATPSPMQPDLLTAEMPVMPTPPDAHSQVTHLNS